MPALLAKYLPNGLLGVGITALVASFMSGMAGNVTAFNTVWTYDLYQRWFKPDASDAHLVRVGRITTVVGLLISAACAYAAAHGGEPEGACRARLGTSGFTAAWADQCLANHAAAWIKNENGHFRARLWGVGKALVASLPPPDVADPARVVEALARELPP